MNIKYTLIFFFTLYFGFYGFASEPAKSKLTGVVVDKSNNETIPGVPVIVEGTTYTGVTDLDGKYSIEIPAGTYSLILRYIGYNPKNVTGIIVHENQVVTVNVALETKLQDLKEVTITADMRRESIGSILLMQKKSATIQDGISSESIKKSTDKNSGEIIRRVSGASLQEGRFVIIRGLNERYTSASINEVPLSSTEPDRKAFSFDLFPSSLLDNIIIIKTAAPELSGEFAGGVLQLNTKDIPERNFLNFSVGTGFNTQSTFKQYNTYAGGKTDWLGKDDGTRALPDEFPDSEKLKKSNQTEKIEYSKILPNDWGIQSKENSPLNQSYEFSTGFNKKVFKNDFGFIAALNYNKNNKTINVERSDYDFDGQQNYNFSDIQYRENVFWGGILDFSYKVGGNSKFSLKNIYSVNAEDQVINRSGIDLENVQYIEATSLKYTSTSFANTILTGEHFLPGSKTRIKWYGGMTTTTQSVPDLRRMYYYRNLDPSFEDTTLYAYVPIGNGSPNYAGKFYSDLNEKNYCGEVNVSFPLKFLGDKHFIKTGFFEQYKSRDFDARVLGYVITNPGTFNYNLLLRPIDSLFMTENMSTKGFRIDEITNPSDQYTASSNLHSGYIQFDNVLSSDLRFVWGLRVENFIQKLNSFGYSNDTIEVNSNYLDILPSFNATYSLNEKTNLRFSASRTVARPEFRELAPFGFYDFTTASSIFGNDSLKRTQIVNLDVRYEMFPSNAQLLSASVFYKYFKNPIEPTVESYGAGSRRISFINSPSAFVTGIEFEIRKKLDFASQLVSWSQFENMTVFGNIAFMYSRVDKSSDLRATEDRSMQGQSPYVLNCGISYLHPKSGFGVNVIYNRIGTRISQVGNSSYLSIEESPRNLLDIQLSKRIFEKSEFKINISDLLNEEGMFYQDQNNNGRYAADVDTGIAKTNYGTNYSISISYRF
jgi:outer membrane receptor protein involved in Fe transport